MHCFVSTRSTIFYPLNSHEIQSKHLSLVGTGSGIQTSAALRRPLAHCPSLGQTKDCTATTGGLGKVG